MTTESTEIQTDYDDSASRKVFQDLLPKGPRALVRPASRSFMFGPLAVLIAILPGLYGLTHWDLTPPGPWWGLRGLAVLDEGLWIDQSPMAESIAGSVAFNSIRNIALQPPLFAWLEACLVYVSPTRSPLATVLPSYTGGVLLILVVYFQARTWSKPGTAILAVWIFAFHIRTIDAMQRAGPATLGAASLVGALQFYSLHIQAGQGGRIRGRILYAMACGACLGLSLMSVGLIGLMIIPVIGIHQVALNAGESPLERPRHWYEAWRVAPGLFYGATSLVVAMVISAPWHVWMTLVHSSEFWMVLLEPSRNLGSLNRGPIGHLLDAAPLTLVPALYAAWRAVQKVVSGHQQSTSTDEHLTRAAWQDQLLQENGQEDQTGLLLWTIWSSVALALSVYWPLGPQNTLNLILSAALSLMAADTIRGLSQRYIKAEKLVWITPLTVLGLCWWGSETLRKEFSSLQRHGILSPPGTFHFWQIPKLAIGLIALTLGCLWLRNWCRKNDSRTRFILAGFVSLILFLQMGFGVNELRFRHPITRQLLELRESIVRRNQVSRIQQIHVVGSIAPESLSNLRAEPLDQSVSPKPSPPLPTQTTLGIDPAGRLRFVLHSALPRVPQTDHNSIEPLFDSPKGERLVIMIGPENRLSIADQARLGLEPIYPGMAKIMTAFATSRAASLSINGFKPLPEMSPVSGIQKSKVRPSPSSVIDPASRQFQLIRIGP